MKALGFALANRNMVQVSMNLTDYTVTSVPKVFDEIQKEANAHDVEIAEGELVGLIPLEAVCDIAARFLKISTFSSSQILERRVWG